MAQQQGYGYGPPQGQPQAAPGGGGGGGPIYQITTIDAGCSGVIDTNQINGMINQMAGQQYRLQFMYMDIRNTCGPCCPKRCAVMIFRRADVPL